MSGTPAQPGAPKQVRRDPRSDFFKFNACCVELETFYAELRKKYDAETISAAEACCRYNQAL
jgi:hypothetical protein